MARVSIIIPAFNEEHAVGDVLRRIWGLALDAEVIVVDDGSTDRTGEVAAELGAKVLRHPVNMGYGRSLKDGIRAASSAVVVITDADGTYPVERTADLLAKMDEGFDMAVGARQGREYRGSFLKMPARAVFKLLTEFTVGRRIPDVNSGFRAFRKADAEAAFPDLCDGFSFTTSITLLFFLSGKMVAYIPIPYGKRVGRSKVRMLRDSLRTLQYITEAIVRHNPLKLFLLLSLGSLLLGILADAYFRELFFTLLGAWTGAVVFSIGLVAESIRRQRM